MITCLDNKTVIYGSIHALIVPTDVYGIGRHFVGQHLSFFNQHVYYGYKAAFSGCSNPNMWAARHLGAFVDVETYCRMEAILILLLDNTLQLVGIQLFRRQFISHIFRCSKSLGKRNTRIPFSERFEQLGVKQHGIYATRQLTTTLKLPTTNS